MSEKAFCPECEIRELQSAISRESIEKAVSKMARIEGVTTEEGEYERRLLICKSCPSLRSEIMCAECGSYVAYRARIISSTCPYPGCDKWKKTGAETAPAESAPNNKSM